MPADKVSCALPSTAGGLVIAACRGSWWVDGLTPDNASKPHVGFRRFLCGRRAGPRAGWRTDEVCAVDNNPERLHGDEPGGPIRARRACRRSAHRLSLRDRHLRAFDGTPRTRPKAPGRPAGEGRTELGDGPSAVIGRTTRWWGPRPTFRLMMRSLSALSTSSSSSGRGGGSCPRVGSLRVGPIRCRHRVDGEASAGATARWAGDRRISPGLPGYWARMLDVWTEFVKGRPWFDAAEGGCCDSNNSAPYRGQGEKRCQF